jgi:NADH/NAD ratio-sensing transcriptional regulator Rex
MLLANALIEKKEPMMAMEIVDTLDIDPELMGEDIKDILYRTGVALESAKNFDEALKMYDMICNADINYKDAFDRSDKIYAKKKA